MERYKKILCCGCSKEVQYGIVVRNYRFCNPDCFNKKLNFAGLKELFRSH